MNENCILYYSTFNKLHCPLNLNDIVEIFEEFIKQNEVSQFAFPPTLSSGERRFVHDVCGYPQFEPHIISFSSGAGHARFITIAKKGMSSEKMKKVEELMSHSLMVRLRSQFVQDLNLPIPEMASPYFEYYLTLWDTLLGTISLYKLFVKTVKFFPNPADFFQNGKTLISNMQSKLSSVAAKVVPDRDPNKILAQFPDSDRKNDNFIIPGTIYSHPNHEKYFISVDIRSANLSCLSYWKKDLVLGAKNWEEFCVNFTSFEYYQKLKKFRVIVFSKILTSVQQQIWKSVINKVRDLVIEAQILDSPDHYFTGDEIIFRTTAQQVWQHSEKIRDLLKEKTDFSHIIKVEPYRLIMLHRDAPFAVKKLITAIRTEPTQVQSPEERAKASIHNNPNQHFEEENFQTNIVFKCCNPYEAAQCYKWYYGIPLNKKYDITHQGLSFPFKIFDDSDFDPSELQKEGFSF